MNKEIAETVGNSVVRIKSYVDRMGEQFTQHPQENSMTYVEHFWKTMKQSIKMGVGSFQLMIHAYFPFMCKKTVENMISALQEDTAE